MNYSANPIPATFVNRLNRFLVRVRLKSPPVSVLAHLPNPGRLAELLQPDSTVFLLPVSADSERKTPYDLILVSHQNLLISVDSRLPNSIFLEGFQNGRFPELKKFSISIHPEYSFQKSRIDFIARGRGHSALIEVKSCTLVENRVAFFPDAASERGVRHLEDLMKALKMGFSSFVYFIIQREDAMAFSPNDHLHPQFGVALRKAVEQGVHIFAYRCKVTLVDVTLDRKVPLHL